MHYECRHIMPNGARCHCPALRDKPYCYFHFKLHDLKKAPSRAKKEPLNVGVLEDKSAILVAVAKVLDSLGSSRLDPRTAGLFLYGIQLVSQNVERKFDLIPFRGVESVTKTRGGDEMAPTSFICADGDDCSQCPLHDTCTLPCKDKPADDE
jgi:hypothetical protein